MIGLATFEADFLTAFADNFLLELVLCSDELVTAGPWTPLGERIRVYELHLLELAVFNE